MRANLEAFRDWRLRPRMLAGNDAARHLRRGARPAVAGAVPARADRRALDRARGSRGRRGEGGSVVRRADGALERRDALDRGGRGDERAALVPALLGERPRDLRELRPARRGRRLRRDRRHARHADARLAPARPAPGVPAVHPGRGLRPVLHRPVFLSRARQDAGRGPADRRRDDARDLPEPRADVGRPRLAAGADDAADPRQGRAHRRRRAARAPARRRRRGRLEPRRPAGRRRGRGARRARRGARRAAGGGRADGRRHPLRGATS